MDAAVPIGDFWRYTTKNLFLKVVLPAEAIAADHALSVRLQGEGAVFSYRGMMLIGGIGPGYGDILISAEPMVFE